MHSGQRVVGVLTLGLGWCALFIQVIFGRFGHEMMTKLNLAVCV